MKLTHLLLAGLMATLLMASSCNDDPDPEPQPNTAFELVFQGYFGGQEFFVQFPYFIQEDSMYFEFETYKFYVSDVTLVGEDGTEAVLDTLAFVDFAENHLPFGKKPGTGKTAHAGGEFLRYPGVQAGSYKGVRFGVGITADRNTGDGSPYVNDPDHPLHPSRNMNWGMGPGFIVQSLLGFADSSDNAFDQDRAEMVYHLGLDDHYKTYDFTAPQHAFEIREGEETQFILDVDIKEMLWPASRLDDRLDVYEVGAFHTVGEDPALVQTVSGNMGNAWFFSRIDNVPIPSVD